MGFCGRHEKKMAMGGGGGIPKTLKWRNVSYLKTRYRTNIEDGIQSYYKLSFC